MENSENLRVLFWNVRNLGDDRYVEFEDEDRRIEAIAELIVDDNVDVACIAESKHPEMKSKLNKVLPAGYTVYETSADNPHKLMVIFKNAADKKITLTQRDEFKGQKDKDRPYPLIQVTQGEQSVAILPMHAKAGSRQFDFQLRQFRLRDVSNLAAELNAQNIPLIALGDMNTVGNGNLITPDAEVRRTQYLLYDPACELAYEDWKAARMILLQKDYKNSWHGVDDDNRYGDEDMDHVFVSEWFAPNIKPVNDDGAQIHLGGWRDFEDPEERDQWVRDYSDHGYMILDVDMSKPAP